MPAAVANRFDVAIVGAGAAGLAAARDLSRAGASVALLEARSRLGGRVWTERPAGWPVPLELGAEFIHGRNAELFRDAAEAGLRVVRLTNAHFELRGSRLVSLGDVWGRFDAVLRRLSPPGRDRSIADFLRGRGRSLSAEQKKLLISYVESYNAAPIETASSRAFSTAGQPPVGDDDRAQFRLIDGYGSLIDWLASGIDPERCKVFFSTVVRRIVWSRGRVRVATDRGDFRAGRILVTVSIGVLRAAAGSLGAIAFDPEPPPFRRALAGLAMGDVARLVLRFREPLWREAPRVEKARSARGTSGEEPDFFHFPSAAFPVWWTSAPIESPVLTAWAGGAAAQAVLRLAPAVMLRDAIAALASGLGVPARSIARALLDWRLHDWTADPFSRGAYAHARVGGASAAETLARPVQGTLFFAGEALGRDETGTVAGAIESGRRAARRMAR